jgi:hypothetical protein
MVIQWAVPVFADQNYEDSDDTIKRNIEIGPWVAAFFVLFLLIGRNCT